MRDDAAREAASELQFAALVDAIADDPSRRDGLRDLLREDHPSYDQRGATAVVRMRGWVLAALARTGVPDDALVFVLEELDTGRDPYLVAAAARALRACTAPRAAFAPFLMRAFENVRYHDEPVTFDAYGEYATASGATTPVGEVMATLAWLGPLARGVLPEIEALRSTRGVSRRLRVELDRAVAAIAGASVEAPDTETCCGLPGGIGQALSWLPGLRQDGPAVAAIQFEDQDGSPVRFHDVFHGQPSIVVFFYTRCDNPLKCSLTVAKLARVQRMLDEQGLAGRVRTAAITYDPAYDLPSVLRGYGESRSLRMDGGHRMLRATQGMAALRGHFGLGVNFVGSIVNRHRIELFVLDAGGRVRFSFERVRWDEQQVIDRAAALVREADHPRAPSQAAEPAVTTSVSRAASGGRAFGSPAAGLLGSVGVAFFPKCPVCWAAYMSVFGVAGLERMPYAPWMLPVLTAVLLVNVASVWWRSRATGRRAAVYLVAAGALAILGVHAGFFAQAAAWGGVALTLLGSVLSAFDVDRIVAGTRPRALQPRAAPAHVTPPSLG